MRFFCAPAGGGKEVYKTVLESVLFALAGYLSGSVLYANIFAALLGKKEIYKNSADQNPGTMNAFRYGGFLCGVLTLVMDLSKAFLPVFLYRQTVRGGPEWGLSLVLAAPVLGHVFSLFHGFHGGKGIAATFACLLALIPYGLPFWIFAASFLFFSLGVRVYPNYYRTIAAYLLSAVCMGLWHVSAPVLAGYLVITAAVCIRLFGSKEEKERFEIKWLWMR